MKIAIWHNLPSGGGKRALYDHVRGLVSRRHTIECWCPPSADRSYLPLTDFVKEHVVPLPWPPDGRRGFYLTRSYGLIRDRLEMMERHCWQCAEEMNDGGFDLLFANPCTFFRTSPVARFARMPTVLYLQEPYRHLYEALPALPWMALDKPRGWWRSAKYVKERALDALKVAGLRLQAREEVRNARAFSSILVNSYYSRESVLRAYGLNSDVCYLGIDARRFEDRKMPRENLVVGIGAFHAEKNIELAVRALGYVRQPRPRLLWIGNMASQPYLEAVATLAKSEGVEFEPRVRIDDEELICILNRARVMVYAPRLEPFGLAALEASACGLPVVAVAEGGVRETVIDGENGLLVEHHPEKIAQGIQYLLDHPEDAVRLGENGRKRVMERWTIDQSVDRLERRLADVLENQQTRDNFLNRC